MVLRRIALILVALLPFGVPLAAEAFTTVDLAGTWSIRALSVSGSSGDSSNWTIGTLTLDATGAVTGGWTLSANNSVSEPIVSGSFTLAVDGRVTGTVTDSDQVFLEGHMLGSRNIMVLTHEGPVSDPDRHFGLVALVRAPAISFATADFAGTWRIEALKSAAVPGGDGGSAFGCCIILDDAGHVTGGELNFFDGESPSLGGDLTMAANGSFTGTLVTSLEDAIDVRGVMVDKDLGVVVFTLSGTDDGYGMFFLQRAVDVGFQPDDLVGTWQLTQMHVDEFEGNVGGWVRGNLTVVLPPPGAEECGCAVVTGGTFVSSDGNVSHAVSGGVLVMDAEGLMLGYIATDDDSAIYLEAAMGAGKDIILGVNLSANVTDETLSDGLFVLSKNAAPSSLQLSAASYTVSEAIASHQVTITVKRTGSTASSATVDYATADLSAFAGTDYTSQSGTLTFPVGSTTQTFTVPIIDNTDEDGTRIFRVLLSNPVGAGVALGSPNSATVTISDNENGGAITFALAARTVSEGAGSLSALVTRSGTNLGGNVTVPFSFRGTAVNGTDYSATPGVLTFAAGVSPQSASIPITLLDTPAADGSRTLIIDLGTPSAGATLGALKTMIITITDNEQSVAFSAGNYSVTETVGTATLRVNRAGALTNQVMVQYQTVDGTAHAGLDYGTRSGTLTFGPGVTFQNITVPIVNNTLVDGARAFDVQLFGPAGGGLLLGAPSAATVFIGDNDAGGVFKFAGNVSVVEGGTASLVVTRTVAAGTVPGNASVTYSVVGGTAAPAQYAVLGGGTLTFGAGEVSKTIPVATVNDFVVNGSRTVMVGLGSPSAGSIGTPGQATVTITDDDKGGQVQFAVTNITVPESAGSISLLVSRLGTKLADNVTVPFSFGGTAVNGFDYLAAPGVLTFAANQSSASIFLTVLDDLAPDGDKTLTVELGPPTGGASLGAAHTATVKILDNEQSVSFSSASYAVSESAGRATIRVNRTGATTSLVSVQYETLDGTAVAGTDYGNRSGTLTFPIGSTFQTFTVPILNNSRVDGARALTLALFDPAGFGLMLGSQSTATLVINDDDTGGLIRFAANTSVTEGGTAALSVIRSGVNLAGNVTVTYGLAGGSAPASEYSLLGSGTVTFGPGETSKKIFVSTVNDALFTGSRTVLVDLCCASGGGVLGTPSAATVTITDNDSAALVRFASPAVSVLESAGTANLTVLRSGNMAANVTVPLTYAGTAVAGTDYAEPPASLTLLPGQASASIPITLFDDALTDGSRTLIVTLGPPGVGAALGVPASTTLTIRDDEATVQFSGKWNGNSPEVVRSGVTDTSVTVHYHSFGGTATDGVDYGALDGTLTFGPGVTKQYIPLQVRRDNIAEGPESFTIELSAPTGGAHLGPFSTLLVTIQDNDYGGTVNFASAQYVADAGDTVTVTVKRTGGLDTVLFVNFTTSDGTAVAGTDYSPTSGTLIFAAGQTTKTFTVETLETFGYGSASLELHLSVAPGSAVLGGNSSAILTISGLGEGGSARAAAPRPAGAALRQGEAGGADVVMEAVVDARRAVRGGPDVNDRKAG